MMVLLLAASRNGKGNGMKHTERMMTAIGICLFVAGMIVLFNGTNIGMFLANQTLSANGGSMGTEKYYFIMESNTLSCQLGGTVLSIIGGISTVIFGYRCVK